MAFDDDLDYRPTGSTRSGVALPRIPTSPDFRLGAHTDRWEVDIDAGEEGRILPQLVRIDVESGAHHIGKDGDPVGMYRAFAARGWTILEPDVISGMPGTRHRYYVRPIAVPGGRAHLPVWTQALSGSPRTLPDAKLYREFRCYLVDEGLVPMPRPDQMRAQKRRAETSHAICAREADRDPRQKRAMEQWERVIAVWDRALAAAEGTVVVHDEPAISDEEWHQRAEQVAAKTKRPKGAS